MAATQPEHDTSTTPPATANIPTSWHLPVATMARTIGAQLVLAETFPARGDQIARIRKTVQTLAGNRRERDTMVWLTDELATNAVVHSGSEAVGVIIARTATGLRVAIADQHRAGFPHPYEKTRGRDEADAENGRGLLLLDQLTARWGIIREPGFGLSVWFDVA